MNFKTKEFTMEPVSGKTSSSSVQMGQSSPKKPGKVRTVQNIYMLTNPRSGDGFASEFLEKYPRVNRCEVEVAVTRKNGAI